jgi:hypothetical protein
MKKGRRSFEDRIPLLAYNTTQATTLDHHLHHQRSSVRNPKESARSVQKLEAFQQYYLHLQANAQEK